MKCPLRHVCCDSTPPVHLYSPFSPVLFFLMCELFFLNSITFTDTHLPTDGCRAAEGVYVSVCGELGSVNFYNRKSAWSQPTHQGCWEAGGPGPQPWERHEG